MFHLKRTVSEDLDFQKLVYLLDEDLKFRDGEDHSFFAQFNKSDSIRNVVLCYNKDVAVGCGAFKKYDDSTVEIKRMFVIPEFRGQGVGALILKELELWALELDYMETILETGKRQPEAIRLYQKNGYSIIPNYGQYKDVESSVCMTKRI